MKILKQPIERTLSALLGAEVKFEEFKVSLLAATIEVTGVKIGSALSAARGVANVSLGRALKGEIIVKSITIEQPNVDISALPKRRARPKSEEKDASPGEDKTRWTFDIEKLLILDGRVVISPKLTLEKLLLELKRDDAGYKLTALADQFADGALRGHLQYDGKLSLAQLLALL